MVAPQNFDEHFRIPSPPAGGIPYRFGTAGIVVENIDSIYEGPTTRGQDTPRIYMPGSFSSVRQHGSSSYTFALIVSGYTDVSGEPKDPSKTLREQAHENIDDLRRLTFRDAFNSPIRLQWHNRPGVSDTFIEAICYVDYALDVRQIGNDHFRVILTFNNPNGVWLGAPVVTPFSLASGLDIQNVTINPRGNIQTSFISILVATTGAGTDSLQIQTGLGQFLAVNSVPGEPVFTSPGAPPLRDLFFNINERLLIETDNFPSSVNTATDIRSGLVGYTDQRWAAIGPGGSQIGISRRGTEPASGFINARGAYV